MPVTLGSIVATSVYTLAKLERSWEKLVNTVAMLERDRLDQSLETLGYTQET